ncbi:MAG: transcription elongation factor GreA [Lachnospiraceae bacterium]|nr:transcription elongation factor GreA [Lachnospiraceae bacterium]MBQ2088992.1 transcription elongation factor GreA [Lachnospiraceae bacterium]MBR1571501.1 transcription elongation factor GreA [Lachnospiraceae bacterium]MCR5353944.1 transcription elongation factor GreA [Lachnospiraceae bacterium]
MEKKTVLTREGKEKLEEELETLKVERRDEVAEKLKEARAQGDLSENAEYDAAKDEQAEIEARIEEIEQILKNAEIHDETDTDVTKAGIGATVTILDMEFNDEYTYKIVGSTEASSLDNKISNESPVGSAIIGHSEGDVVTIETPDGESAEFKILAIKH